MTKILKGICYEPFPHGYDPSTCNDTCIFFGSDIAAYNIKPLWGDTFSPVDGPDAGKVFQGRDDIKRLSALGVNLIRLYDWDARNDHTPFLDHCHAHGIQVLVPVSNYNLGAFGPPPPMAESIHGLMKSFMVKNQGGTGFDYHPAIYAVIIGSETDQIAQIRKGYLVEYTQEWVEIEQQLFAGCKQVRIGHPISFAMEGPGWSGLYPCWGYLQEILPPLLADKDIKDRLMICPHTYNDAAYLYVNADGNGKGWVELTGDMFFNIPILFCEIGCSRLQNNDYLQVIQDQLKASISYGQANPTKLLGICHFQYCDKVWIPGTTEGSFGITGNTVGSTDVVLYGPKDFNHCTIKGATESMNIQVLEDHPSFKIIEGVYKK